MPGLADGPQDVALTFAGVRKEFLLEEGQGGLIPFAPAYLDEVAQQQDMGAFSATSVPTSVITAVRFDDWSGGAGVHDAAPGSVLANTYSYSRGVDLSYGRRAYRSLAPATMDGIATPITGFYRSPTFGWYAFGGQYVYRWSLSGQAWAQVYDSGDAAITVTDVMEYANTTDTYLFLAFDEAADMAYATDGETFSNTVLSETAKFLAVRGVTSNEPVMWKIRGNGLMSSSTVGTGSWSSEDPLTPEGETVTALKVSNALLWIFFEGGWRAFDGTNLDETIEVSFLKEEGNGSGAFVAPDGTIFFNLANRVVGIDPTSYATATVWETHHPELNGTVGGVGGNTNSMWFALNTVRGDCYIMRGPYGGPFHTVSYRERATCGAITPAGAEVVHPTNPCLMAAFANAGDFPYDFPINFAGVEQYVLPREGRRPEDDANCRYELGTGTVYGSWLDKGVAIFTGWLNGGRVVGERVVGSRRITLGYDLDGVADTTDLVVASGPGLTEDFIDTDTEVEFTRIRHVLSLEVSDTTKTPVLIAASFDVTPNPPRFRVWTLPLRLGSQLRPRGGGSAESDSYHAQFAFLEAAAGKRGLFEDYFGDRFVVKCLNVSSNGFRRKNVGMDRGAVEGTVNVTLVEIRAISDDSNIFTWDDSRWDDGEVWGPDA